MRYATKGSIIARLYVMGGTIAQFIADTVSSRAAHASQALAPREVILSSYLLQNP
jgi:hypothetical protein